MEPQKLDLIPMPEIKNWEGLNCPMPPGCGHELFLIYTTSSSFNGQDFNEGNSLPVNSYDMSDWEVKCLAGHVILTPREVDYADEDSVESDEVRIFTAKDMQRLARVLRLMNVDWESVNVE